MSGSNPENAACICAADAAGVEEAAQIILRDGCVAVPTETVYGLAADATSATAVAGIYATKGRPDFNPLIVHVADMTMARTLGHFDPVAQALASRFWPGALTVVVPLLPDCAVAPAVTAGLSTIALRCPAHGAMQALVRATGRPLAAPSANRSGGVSPTTAAHVAASLGARVPLILDGGPCEQGLESTIVGVGAEQLTLLRPGPITADMLTDAVALPVVQHDGSTITAPGQMTSHYAPGKPVLLDCVAPPHDAFVIGFAATHPCDVELSATGDLAEAARNLFAALHLGDISERRCIAVAPIPATGIGVAINDRLRRAAA